MKNNLQFIFTILLLWGASFAAHSQTYLTEAFSGGAIPATWTDTDNIASGQSWEFNNPGARTITGGGFDADFAMLDSDNYGNGNGQDATLTSPAFDVTGATLIKLQFDHQYRSCCGSTADVEVSPDGVTWTNVLSLTTTSVGYPNPVAQEDIDVTAILTGSTTAQVRFTYVGDWAYWWAIDNVQVINLTCTAPTATFAVTEDCAAGFSVDVDVTDMGDAASYDIQSGGASVGTVSGVGMTTVGPFPNGTPIDIELVHDSDPICNLTESGLVNPTTCPTISTVTCGTPTNTTHCYTSNDDNTFLFTASDGTSLLKWTFNAGGIESCCDDITIYDGSDATGAVLFTGNNSGDLAGVTVNSTGTALFMTIAADGSVDCASGSTCCTATWDWDVECLTCDPVVYDAPVVVDDCGAMMYTIEVNITSIGDGNSTLTDGTTPQAITAVGLMTFGPYPTTATTTLNITHDTDMVCDAALGSFDSSCPPCINGTSFGGTAANNGSNVPAVLSTCYYAGEYGVITGLLAANDYEASSTGADDYITVVAPDGTTIIASGPSPVAFNVPADGDYQIHVNLNDNACGTENACRALSVACTSCPPVNNDCPGAVDITDTAIYTSSTANATDSSVGGCASSPDDDVWFTVTTDGVGTDLTITVTGGVEYELFSGACGALVSVDCNASPYTGLATGTQYWIRCYDPNPGFGGGSANRSIDPFTIQAGGSLLPIELASFSGYADDRANVLEFSVAAQENVEMFYIERSRDGINDFEVVAETAAAGTTNELLSYRLMDETPLAMGYYRLVSKDFDGKMQNSNVIAIERHNDKFAVASVYPVPTTDNSVFVEFDNDQDGDVQIIVTDIAGKQVLSTQITAIAGSNKTEVNIASLSAGTYFMSLSNGESVIVERIIKN